MRSVLSTNYAIICMGSVDMLFSYQTLVGIRGMGVCYISKHTPTTGRHQHKAGFARGVEVSQEELEELAMKLVYDAGIEYMKRRLEGEN